MNSGIPLIGLATFPYIVRIQVVRNGSSFLFTFCILYISILFINCYNRLSSECSFERSCQSIPHFSYSFWLYSFQIKYKYKMYNLSVSIHIRFKDVTVCLLFISFLFLCGYLILIVISNIYFYKTIV